MGSFKSQQGSAMIFVLMLMMILIILTTAMLQFTYTEVLHVSNEEKSKQAYYLARTGAEATFAIWFKEGATNKPEGKVKRVYLNAETNEFQTEEPNVIGGYFDATIEEAEDLKNDEGEYEYGIPPTRIKSVGTVGNHSRTVSLITVPFKHGHELGWFDENGEIEEGEFEDFDEEFIYLSLDLDKEFIPEDVREFNGSFGANQIIFASPLKIDLGKSNKDNPEPIYNPVNKTFIVKAGSIYFHDVEVSICPYRKYSHWLWGSWERTERNGRLVLRVPDDFDGFSYPEVPDGALGKRYGKVHFDGEKISKQNYQWEASWFLIYYDFRIEAGNTESVKTPEGIPLAGNSFYFKDGTDLLNLQPRDLIPFTDDTERPNLKGIKPYYWE